jgi:AraC-like DNA-binding protein
MSPALYFSVLYFTMPDRAFKRVDYLHFIPFFLFLFFVVTVVTGINRSFLFSWYYDIPGDVRRIMAITLLTAVRIQMISYWVLSYVILTRHTKNVQVFSSTSAPVSLWWLRYFLIGLGAVLVLSLNEVASIVPAIVPVTNVGYLIMSFYLAYFSVRQQEIYPYRPKDVTEIREIINEVSNPVQTKRLSDEELAVAKRKLIQVMELEKIYLDPNLGLPQLATKVNLSTHDLSYLLNEGFGENFFQFINRHRIEEAKFLLRSDRHKHLNILGIAYESGFRSKSTFNATFKKITGVSPSDFMRSRDAVDEAAA